MTHFRFNYCLRLGLLLVLLASGALQLDAQIKPIFESGKTLLPGTSDPLYIVATPFPDVSIIHDDPFVIARSVDSNGKEIQHALRYRNNQWEIVIDGRTAMPGGLPVASISYCSGEMLYLALNGSNEPRDAAVIKYDGNTVKYIISSINEKIGSVSDGYILEYCEISKTGVMTFSVLNSKFDNFYYKNENLELYYLKNNIISKVPNEYNVGFLKAKAFDYFDRYSILSEDGLRVYFVGVTKSSTDQLGDEEYNYYYYQNRKIHKYINSDDIIQINGFTSKDVLFTYPMVNYNDSFYFFTYGRQTYLPNISPISDYYIRSGIYKKTKSSIEKVVQSGDTIEGITLKEIDWYFLNEKFILLESDNNFFTITPYFSKFIAEAYSFDDDLYHFQKLNSFDENYVYYINYYTDPGNTDATLSLLRTSFTTLQTEKISDYDNLPRFRDDYTFEVYNDKIILCDNYKIYYTPLDELKNNVPLPFYTFFDSWLEADPDMHYVRGYEWIYAPSDYWPLVYSFTADLWFYLHGDTGYPLMAYAFGLGWIHSTPEIWPMYYSFERQDWYSFNGQNPE